MRQAARQAPGSVSRARRPGHGDELIDADVTGDGVIVDARSVAFPVRIVSGLIDGAVSLILGITVLLVAAELGGEGAGGAFDANLGQAMAIIWLVGITVVLPTVVETLTRGRSLGRLIMGTRVVRDDGGPIRLRQALIRAMTGVLENWLTMGSIAVIVSALGPRGKRLGDLLAGTYVRRERSTAAPAFIAQTAPPLEAWADSADITALPDAVVRDARQLLARRSKLDPRSRQVWAQSIAAALEPYVAPGPPPGTPPEMFIEAVLAERRERDYVVAITQQERADNAYARARRLPFGTG